VESGANLDARELEGRGRAALPWPSHLWGSGVVGGIRPGEVRPQGVGQHVHPQVPPIGPPLAALSDRPSQPATALAVCRDILRSTTQAPPRLTPNGLEPSSGLVIGLTLEQKGEFPRN
jgi:hypothetical protein